MSNMHYNCKQSHGYAQSQKLQRHSAAIQGSLMADQAKPTAKYKLLQNVNQLTVRKVGNLVCIFFRMVRAAVSFLSLATQTGTTL